MHLDRTGASKASVQSLADLKSESDDFSEDDFGSYSDASESGDKAQSPEIGSDDDGQRQTEGSQYRDTIGNKTKRKGPTADDVRQARSASELFKSNVFKLQVAGVLDEIKLEESAIQTATKTLFGLKEVLQAAKSKGPFTLQEARRSTQCRIPWPERAPPSDAKYTFGFEPPTDVNVIGSFSLGYSTRRPGGCGIDVLVVSPNSLFAVKDYANMRYWYKRAFYLASVADIVAGAANVLGLGEARFEFDNDDVLKPLLRVEFAGGRTLSRRLHIRIHIGISPDLFPVRKLDLDKSNLRENDSPTPQYNASILKDMFREKLHDFVWRASRRCEGFRDAVKLGGLWLYHRGLGSRPNSGGFGNFELAVTIAALLETRVLLAGYSSYQIFKGLVAYLSGRTLCLNVLNGEQSELPGLWFEVAAGTSLNLLSHAPRWGLAVLKRESTFAAELLADPARDRFSALFLEPSSSQNLRYDWHASVTLTEAVDPPSGWSRAQDALADRIAAVLEVAWRGRFTGDRVIVAAPPTSSWSLSSSPPSTSPTSEDEYQVGVWLDAQEAVKRVTFAPEDAPSGAFGAFWGSRASLRRFQDGSVREAVVWSPTGSRMIIEEIARYALGRHCDAEINTPPLAERYLSSVSTAPFQAHLHQFRELGRRIQELRELPLRISGVHAVSPALRYTSIDEPTPFNAGRPSALITAGAVEFESSAKWPHDPAAREKTKSAFIVRIAELVRKHFSGYAATVGVEPSTAGVETAFVVIQTPEGHYFRLQVLTRYDTKLKALADHSRMVTSIVQRFTVASAVVRTIKMWFRRHLLLSRIPETVIELLALRPFMDSAPYAPPASTSTGFYRALRSLAEWDWREDPIIFDCGDTTDTQTRLSGVTGDLRLVQSFGTLFQRHRQQDPALTHAPWVIFSSADPSGIFWTAQEPRSRIGYLIAGRTTSLAQAATRTSLMEAFTPALEDFEVQFKVDNSAGVQSALIPKNVAVSDPHRTVINATFDPALSFFRDISISYAECLVLFYTDDGGPSQTIAGVWNRAALLPHKFRVGIPYATVETPEGFVVDKPAVLAEIVRLGAGFVKLVRS